MSAPDPVRATAPLEADAPDSTVGARPVRATAPLLGAEPAAGSAFEIDNSSVTGGAGMTGRPTIRLKITATASGLGYSKCSSAAS